MAYHPLRKLLGLAVLYSIIIVGIFVLQFKKEASILLSFGTMQLRLFETSMQNSGEGTSQKLKNSFSVFDKRLQFFSSESSPLILHESQDKALSLELLNWKETSDSSFTLYFTEQVSLSFSVIENQLSIQAEVPKGAKSLILSYKTTKDYAVTDISKNRLLLKSKTDNQVLQAETISDKSLSFSSAAAIAMLGPYKEASIFKFDSIIGAEGADRQSLTVLLTQFRTKLTADYPSLSTDALNEKIAAAYVAELALQGRYHEALTSVPASFIDGTKRTYFSAPYFNSLIKMNQTLVMEKENISYSMQHSIDREILEVFELDSFLSFVLQQPPKNTEAILSLPAKLSRFAPTVSQAAGILSVYTRLFSQQPSSAALLEPLVAQCAALIEKACVFTKPSLQLNQDGLPVNTVLAVKAGKALVDYGRRLNLQNMQAGGTLLISTVLKNTASFDIRTMGDLYPLLFSDNPFYPHTAVIAFENEYPVWAWTAASSITYKKDGSGTISIDTSFLQGEVHYMILNGIEPFSGIEIYGLQYRTDPRFEAYNSSGYVYNLNTKTLFLKYRHKNPVETVRLFYQRPETEVFAPQEQTAEENTGDAIKPPSSSDAGGGA